MGFRTVVGIPDAGVHVGFPDFGEPRIGDLDRLLLIHEVEVRPLMSLSSSVRMRLGGSVSGSFLRGSAMYLN